MRPRRTAVSGFASALNPTSAAPWPEDGVKLVIQPASLEAVHAHSGVVATVIFPVPPVEGMVPELTVTASAHFTGDGAVEVFDEDPQAESAASPHGSSKRARNGEEFTSRIGRA